MNETSHIPTFEPLNAWMARSGMSRWMSYKMLSEGQLRGRKLGKRLLIDVQHGLAFLATLPEAQFAPPKQRNAQHDRAA